MKKKKIIALLSSAIAIAGGVVFHHNKKKKDEIIEEKHSLERKITFYEKHIKRIVDIVCASMALLVFGWLYLLVALLVRVKLGSPIIFKQPRPGKDEKVFNLYKFRTMTDEKDEKRMKFWQCFSYKQTWAFVFGKFMTDGVWWFFLFWTPSYLNTQFGIKTSDPLGMALIFTLYAVTMLSIYGGKLPTIFINRTGMNPYAARMKAMLIFAFFPLVVLLAQPLGTVSPWFPVILIGIGGAAHQSWSANIFSTVGDMFPRTAIASITGIGGMAGGVGSMILQKVAGNLFVYASGTTMVDGHEVEMTKELLEQGAQFVHPAMTFMGFEGKPAGYFIIFCVCAVAYLLGWVIMKALVPKYKPIVLD